MIEVLITEDAEQDYRESFCWYARKSQRAAEGFELEFGHALVAIAANPTRYPRCDDRHRFHLLKRDTLFRSYTDCWEKISAWLSLSPTQGDGQVIGGTANHKAEDIPLSTLEKFAEAVGKRLTLRIA